MARRVQPLERVSRRLVRAQTGVDALVVTDWKTVKLDADFTTSSATAVDVTGLGFTPLPDQSYEIVGCFGIKASSATVGPRPGIAWPTGLTDQWAMMLAADATVTTGVRRGWGQATDAAVAVTGLPDATYTYYADLRAVILAGSSVSGDFKITLTSETGGTDVTMKAGSFIRYRII